MNHAELCAELASLYRERARVHALNVRTRAQAFTALNNGQHSITAIREQVDATVADTTADMIELQGDIDATLVQLRAIEHARVAYRGSAT